MTLPDTVRVKISSENVESIAVTPVVAQDMSLEELIRLMLGVTGKDADRIREILLRGSLVAGASRLRWQGFSAEPAEVEQFLTRYPDSDPYRAFDAGKCFQILLRGGTKPLLIEREAGSKRRLLRSRNFWDELMSVISEPEYVEYSYREHADVFRVRLSPDVQNQIRNAAGLLAYSSFESHVRSSAITTVELYVRR